MRYTWLTAMAVAALSMACAAAVCAGVLSDFDDGTMQGWTATGDVQSLRNPGSGGNPGGCLRLDDRAVGDICWAVAPSEYLGNWHNKTTVSVDLIQPSYSGSQIATAELQISGPGGTYKRVFDERPPVVWRTYGTPITESLWTCVTGSWDALLDNVTTFRVRMEFINGDEITGLDNVSLTDDCTQTTIGLAKQMPNGQCVQVSGVVTRVLPEAMYVQSEDRSAGIRVKNSFALAEGDRVTLSGNLGVSGQERVLENAVVLSQTSGELPKPLHVLAHQLGGQGATAADPQLGTSQDLKETGLLVRASGRVGRVGGSTFGIDDGSGILADITCVSGLAIPRLGATVGLTGISASDQLAEPRPVIIAARDLTVFAVPVALETNLVRNNSAEDGSAACSGTVRPIPEWTPASNLTVCPYGCEIAVSEGVRTGGGSNYFYGGPSNAVSGAEQVTDLTPLAAEIDSGGISATLSAELAGYQTQGDNAKVIATFRDASGADLSTIQVGPQAGTNLKWVHHEASGAVPAGARSVLVKMISTRTEGSNNNGYFDNLSLVLHAAP